MISNAPFSVLSECKSYRIQGEIFSFIKPMLAQNLWITALFGQKNLWITAIFEEKNLWITTKTLIFAPIFNKLDPS